MSLTKKILFLVAAFCLMAVPAYAGSLSVACAANFTSAMKELAALYEKETGTPVTCTFGSTGMLYGQITKGAPYALFFAADEKRPALLFDAGKSEKPVLYAKGKAVLWTAKDSLSSLPDWKAVVTAAEVKKVGIANPKTAPYGLRATEAMATAGVTSKVDPKLAFGKNVGMAFQYAYSGAADAAFIALSQALSENGKNGTYWTIDEAGPVFQAACILQKDNPDAALFLTWLHTPDAKEIISRYGYE